MFRKAGCYTTDCGHTFCNDCIGTWKAYNVLIKEQMLACPICREVFDYRTYCILYTTVPQREEQLISFIPNNMESIRPLQSDIIFNDFIHHNDVYRQ